MSSRDERKRDKEKKQRKEFPILPGMTEAEIEMQIRRRIKYRLEQRNEFIGHAVSFAIVNAVLWLIWLSNGGPASGGLPWPIFITFTWGIGLFSHGWEVYQNSGQVTARRERLIQDEIMTEKERLGLYEKPKNDQIAARRSSTDLRVNEEGELLPLDELLSQDAASKDEGTARMAGRSDRL